MAGTTNGFVMFLSAATTGTTNDGAADAQLPVGDGTGRELADPLPGRAPAENRVWGAQVVVRVARLRAELRRHLADSSSGPDPAWRDVVVLLEEAEAAATRRRGLADRLHSTSVEAAWTRVHAAEALLSTFEGSRNPFASRIAEAVRRGLDPQDERRLAVERDPGGADRGVALAAAFDAVDAAHARAHSFRNALLFALILAGVGAGALVASAAAWPELWPVVFAAAGSAWSGVLGVQVVGACAAVLAGVGSLRSLAGSTSPFQIPLLLLAVKIPAGSVSALLGVLLLSALQIPAVTVATAGTAIAWGIVFGASQELLTRLVDRQAKLVSP